MRDLNYSSNILLNPNRIELVTVGGSDPKLKSSWIFNKAKDQDYDSIEFYDDSIKNVEAVKSIEGKLGTPVNSFHVDHSRSGVDIKEI
jgi:hypothetical protein